jgi:segregation and condensation protein B
VTDESFAARAAAWVPPWAREPEPSAEPDLSVEEESAAEPEQVEPEVVVEPEPVEPEVVVEPEVAEPEPEPEPVVVQELFEVRTPEPAEQSAEPAAPVEPPGPADLAAALEAILMVVDEPVTEQTLAQVLEQPLDRIGSELTRLAGEYAAQGRGFELRRAAGGWRFYTHPDQAAYVERFVLDGQSVRLTQAALETLAVIAYKQPVTRSRMSAIRGVNCDGVVRTLVTRGLAEECGTEPETGAHLYRTTTLFLEKLGLDSVDQLPPLAPFLPDDVDAVADAQR